jgi:hypothetical protein
MELRHSWETPSYSVIQEIHKILLSQKVYYRVQKSDRLVLILIHINTVYNIPSSFCKINSPQHAVRKYLSLSFT